MLDVLVWGHGLKEQKRSKPGVFQKSPSFLQKANTFAISQHLQLYMQAAKIYMPRMPHHILLRPGALDTTAPPYSPFVVPLGLKSTRHYLYCFTAKSSQGSLPGVYRMLLPHALW